MRHGSIAKRLARATRADLAENPSMFRELADKGEKYMGHVINVDILRAIRGEPGPALFPNIRGAVKDLMSAAKMTQWNAEGKISIPLGDLGEDEQVGTDDAWAKAQGFPASAPPAPSTPFDWGNLVTGIVKAGATIGGAVVTAQTQADTQKKLAALQQQTLAARAQAASASMFGGGGTGTTLLIVGIVAVLGIGAFAAFSGGGSSRRRR